MQRFRFLNWPVYQCAQELLAFIIKIVHKIPREYRYELGSQAIRSALSVVLNIAEGSGKASDKEMNRFFEVSLGSLYETLAAIDSMKNLLLVTEDDFSLVLKKSDEIAKQLGGFKKKLDK